MIMRQSERDRCIAAILVVVGAFLLLIALDRFVKKS